MEVLKGRRGVKMRREGASVGREGRLYFDALTCGTSSL